MKVLIFSAFDGVPYTGEEPMRYAAIADQFLKNGHEVIYVTASFSHLHKKYRKVSNTPKGLQLILLPTKSYSNNFSLDRIISHTRLSYTLSDWLEKQDNQNFPDLVIGASPPIFANYVLANFCRKHRIPFIYDIQDLWPEEFIRFLPGKQKLKFLLRPYFSTAEKIVNMATGVSAVSNDYLDYYKTQLIGKPSKVFYLGTDVERYKDVEALKKDNNKEFKIIMLGNSQGGNFIMEAAKAIQDLNNVKLVVAGLKEKTSSFQKQIVKENLERIEVVEWLDKETIFETLSSYDLGLVLINPDSKSAFPNRAFSYFAAGLPVISNIVTGELEKRIQLNDLGITLKVQDINSLKNAIQFCIDKYSTDDHLRIQLFAKKHLSKNDIYQEFYIWVMTNFGS